MSYRVVCQAITNLAPAAEFGIRGGVIEWHSPNPPSQEAIDAEVSRLQAALPREAAHNQRREVRTRAETSGFLFNGHLLDSDRDSILRIVNAAAAASTALMTGADFSTTWSCADGYQMPLDAQGVLTMQAALAHHGQACHNRNMALKGEIEAAEDASSVDVSAGWPLVAATL